MADELNPIEQRLVLVIEEHLKGALKASSELAAVTKSAQQSSKALQKYDKAVKKSTNNLKGYKKGLMHVTATASILTSALRKGMLAFGGFTLALTKAWNSVISGNRALLEYTITSNQTRGSVDRLMQVVKESQKGFENSAFSYRDAAEALAEFQSTSLEASTALGILPGLEKQVSAALQTISQRFGDKRAKELWSNLLGALGNRPREIQQFLDIIAAGGDNMRDRMINLARSIDPANAKLQTTIRDWSNLVQNAGDDSAATRAIKTWDTFWAKLNAMTENFTTNVLTSLADKLVPVFDQLEGYFPAIEKGLSNALGWVSDNLPAIVKGFQGVISTIATLIEKFLGLSTTGKIVAGTLAATVLLPGFGPTMVMAIGKVLGLTKHLGSLAKMAGGPVLSSFASFGKWLVSPGWKIAATGARGLTASLGPIGVALAALTAAAHQFYTWWTKGAEHTWGGQLADWLFDIEKKMDRVNKKAATFKMSWHGFGVTEIKPDKALEEEFERKKKMGKLKPDEQTFEQFAKKRSEILNHIADKDRKRAMKQADEQKKIHEKAADAVKNAGANESLDKAKKSMEQLTKQTEQLSAKAQQVKYEGLDEIEKFRTALRDAGKSTADQISVTNLFFDSFKIATDAATKSADALGKIMETSGFGKFNEMGKASRAMANNLTGMIGEMKEVANQQLRAAEYALMNARTDKERRTALGQIATAQEKMAEAGKLILTRNQLLTQEYEKREHLQRLETEAAKADLEIARATYGAAGLSVKAQMNVVESLQKQKEFLKGQHSLIMQQIAAGDDSIATIQKEKELRNEIKKITADQVNQLKELRDGYLDAVQAQAFGAGKFEKIIITQEKNMRVALEKGIAKANFLLGTVGEAAKLSDVPIARFSAGGYGLEKMEGGMMGDQDIKDWQKELQKNMPDAISKAAAQAATDITFESMRHIDASLFRVDKSVTAFDDVVQKSIKAMSRFGAAAGGGATADVMLGEAMRRGAMPQAATPDRGADYPPAVFPIADIPENPPGMETWNAEQKKAYQEESKRQASAASLQQRQHEMLVRHLENMQRNQAAGLVSGMDSIPQLESIKVEKEETPFTADIPFIKMMQDELNISTGSFEDMMDKLRTGTLQGQKDVIASLKDSGIDSEALQHSILEALDAILYNAGQMPTNTPEIDIQELFGKAQLPDLEGQHQIMLDKLSDETDQVTVMWDRMSSVFKGLNLTMDDFNGEELRNLLEVYKQGVDDVSKATLSGRKEAEKYATDIAKRNKQAIETFSLMSSQAFISAMPETIKRIEDSGVKIGQALNIRPDVIADFQGNQEALNSAYENLVKAQRAAMDGNEELAQSYREHAVIDLAEGANLNDADVESSLTNMANSIESQIKSINGAEAMLEGVDIGKKIYSVAEEGFKGAWDYIQELYSKVPDVSTPEVQVPDATVQAGVTADPDKVEAKVKAALEAQPDQIDAVVKTGLEAKPDRVDAAVDVTPPPTKQVDVNVDLDPEKVIKKLPVEVKLDTDRVEFDVKIPPIATDFDKLSAASAAASTQLKSISSDMSKVVATSQSVTSSMSNLEDSTSKVGYAIDDTTQRMVKALLALRAAANGNLMGVQNSLNQQNTPTLKTPADPLQSQARAQADMQAMIESSPNSPQIGTAKADGAGGATVDGRPLKTARRAMATSGAGGGRISQLFREGFAKMFEAASIMDDYIDEDAVEREDRPGSSGNRTIPGG